MPWCTGCDRFLSPATVSPDGTCPKCGRAVDPGRAHAPAVEPAVGGDAAERRERRRARAERASRVDDPDEETLPVPWHLKLLVGAVALYLGYRAYEGIAWVVGRF